MLENTKQPLYLIGLPGAGRSRLQASLNELDISSIKIALTDLPSALIGSPGRVLTVIDVRSMLGETLLEQQAEEYLAACLHASDAVVLLFLAEASLEVQMQWQAWLKQKTNLPRLRSLNTELSATSLDKLARLTHNTQAKYSEAPIFKLEALEVPVKRMSLQHFLMSLDGLKQSDDLAIWRVKGAIDTIEYSHPVQVEVTVNRLDIYPLNTVSSGVLTFVGKNLSSKLLAEVIQACQV